MLLNFDLGWVFLHNPKAAGISMSMWLNDFMGFEPIVPITQPHVCMVCGTTSRHCWHVGDAVCEGFEVKPFCIVRNPISRLVSGWNYYLNALGYREGFRTFVESQILPGQHNYVELCRRHEGKVLHMEILQQDIAEQLDFGTSRLSFATMVHANAGVGKKHSTGMLLNDVAELVSTYYPLDYEELPEYEPTMLTGVK